MIENHTGRYKSNNFFETARSFVGENDIKISKRRIISKEECLLENWSFLVECFKSISLAIDKYNNILSDFTPDIRVRNFEASLLMQLMAKEMFIAFPEHSKFALYKRFVVNINGYQFFPKKLNYKNMPMNIVTAFTSKLNNQQQGNLFKDDPVYQQAIQPVLYIGYRKDRFGTIGDLKVVYIDENKVRWTIDEDDLSAFMEANSLKPLAPLGGVAQKKEPKLKQRKASEEAN